MYFSARLLFNRAYRPHFGERLGFLPRQLNPTNSRPIWFHAVSVGEVVSVIPLIRKLRADRPFIPIYLSTSTVAGRQAAVHRASSLVNGIFYLPIDYPYCVRRALKALHPSLVVILETEIWPQFYTEIKRLGARLAVVNGRISDRTWPRYQAARKFFAPFLHLPDLIVVQSSTDRERYAHLGAPASIMQIGANLKYDAALFIPSVDIPRFGAEKIWIAASTVGPNERGSLKRHSIDEDDIVIRTFVELSREFAKLLLILAPRQQARFDTVARKLESRGIRFVRRSAMKNGFTPELQLPGVLLLDTVGELAGLYSLANAVFVGGSIAPRGGHNILEPAAAGVPIVVGPHMENFESICRDFLQASGILQIQGEPKLLPAIRELLTHSGEAESLGKRGQAVIANQTGVSEQLADRLWTLHDAT